MNLLAHLYLAEHSHTSAAGQILGDVVKGRLDERYPAPVREGIALHRAIDSFSDEHETHLAMRRSFEAPLRRYAGILVDIGFDYSLARHWRRYANTALSEFSQAAQKRVCQEWPPLAPFGAERMQGLAQILAGYTQPEGIQRALDSVARRLRRRNPVSDALPELLARRQAFDVRLPKLLADLETLAHHADRRARLY